MSSAQQGVRIPLSHPISSDWSYNLLIYSFFGFLLNISCILALDLYVSDRGVGRTPYGKGEPQAFLSLQRSVDAPDADMVPPPNELNNPPDPRPEIGLYIIGWMIMIL